MPQGEGRNAEAILCIHVLGFAEMTVQAFREAMLAAKQLGTYAIIPACVITIINMRSEA